LEKKIICCEYLSRFLTEFQEHVQDGWEIVINGSTPAKIGLLYECVMEKADKAASAEPIVPETLCKPDATPPKLPEPKSTPSAAPVPASKKPAGRPKNVRP
jgi:hypothetical protein